MNSFYFHYNKPASLKAKEPRMSVHFKGQCHIVKFVTCKVPTFTRHKKTQPRCVMAGKATKIALVQETLEIS